MQTTIDASTTGFLPASNIEQILLEIDEITPLLLMEIFVFNAAKLMAAKNPVANSNAKSAVLAISEYKETAINRRFAINDAPKIRVLIIIFSHSIPRQHAL